MNKTCLAVCSISFFLLIVLFSRCNKSGHSASSQGDSSCLVATFYQGSNNGGSTSINYTYDDQHRLIIWNQITKQSPVIFPFTSQTFRYGPGYILVTGTGGANASPVTDSLVLNPDGSVREHYQPWSGLVWKYIYASNGEVLQRIESRPHDSPPYSDTTVFTWSDGDLVYTSDGDRYTYDTTRRVAPGDQEMITMLNIYGNMAYTIKNTHMQTSADGINFTYIYDASGKVISYGNTATSLITYTCP